MDFIFNRELDGDRLITGEPNNPTSVSMGAPAVTQEDGDYILQEDGGKISLEY